MTDDDHRAFAVTKPQRSTSAITDECVGPYRLIRAIGAGGSARIDLARLERVYDFQRHVVIKRPLEHLRADAQVAASLQREARIGGRLRHPNLVAVLDAGEHDGYDYLALEYVHGCSLRSLMQTDRPGVVRDVSIAVALSIAIDIARGLHDAHELADEHGSPLGLVHRDVSPGNVLLGRDGAVKVSDFGIAKETRVATLSGTLHGTVTYMAPEQCRGHAFDRRADLFSLGVILWELVTRERLFLADNDVASLHRVLSAQVTRPRELRPELSPDLEEIVMMCLAHDPDRRFPTARALADAIEAIAANEGHVVGARRIARTVEDVVGARDVPWIAATTAEIAATTHTEISAIPPPPLGPSDASLVAVIESFGAEPTDSVPTFGPIDERGKGTEEGWLPSRPARSLRATAPPLSRTDPDHVVQTRRSAGRLGWIVGLGLLGGAVAAGTFALTLGGGHAPHRPAANAPALASDPVPPALVPTPSSSPPSATGTPSPPPTTRTSPSVPSQPHHHRHPLAKSAGGAPSPAAVAGTGAANPAGSATAGGAAVQPVAEPPSKPPTTHVEWNPDMLMPSDSSGGSSTGSARSPSK